MTTNNVTRYLKFANVQMAAESLFRLQHLSTRGPQHQGSESNCFPAKHSPVIPVARIDQLLACQPTSHPTCRAANA